MFRMLLTTTLFTAPVGFVTLFMSIPETFLLLIVGIIGLLMIGIMPILRR